MEADLQTVFSRPWTRLFVQSHKDKEVADRDTVGHRGTRIGQVEAVSIGAEPRLRFRTQRALERHDGLQIDLPALGKPFGFAVDRLWVVESGRTGKTRETLRGGRARSSRLACRRTIPTLPAGAPVYCSSSQAVKQHYRHERPKPGLRKKRESVDVRVAVDRQGTGRRWKNQR